MGWLFLGQDKGVRTWTGCIWVKRGMSGYGLAVSGSEKGNEGTSWLYLGQDRGVRIWTGCSGSG
jgi:hypothetical protein